MRLSTYVYIHNYYAARAVQEGGAGRMVRRGEGKRWRGEMGRWARQKHAPGRGSLGGQGEAQSRRGGGNSLPPSDIPSLRPSHIRSESIRVSQNRPLGCSRHASNQIAAGSETQTRICSREGECTGFAPVRYTHFAHS